VPAGGHGDLVSDSRDSERDERGTTQHPRAGQQGYPKADNRQPAADGDIRLTRNCRATCQLTARSDRRTNRYLGV
jgi:hypothetical protein